MTAPRYPIFIPSKGRWDRCLTAQFLERDGIPFKLIVEPQEADKYAEKFGRDKLIVLPFRDRGLVVGLNWLWDSPHVKGVDRYWYIDDNIRGFWRLYKGVKIRCESTVPLRSAEDFTDRYENVGMTGFQYYMFAPEGKPIPPFLLNHHVYSCLLIKRDLPFRWRGPYNADTDMCLQILSKKLCLIQINAFLIWKMTTMKMKGGNTAIYQGDGRLKMARSLERLWPHVVSVDRRFHRPQHVVRGQWRNFDTQLILKKGLKISSTPNDYGLKLTALKKVQHHKLKKLLSEESR